MDRLSPQLFMGRRNKRGSINSTVHSLILVNEFCVHVQDDPSECVSVRVSACFPSARSGCSCHEAELETVCGVDPT